MVTKSPLTVLTQLHIRERAQKTAEPHLHVFSGLPNSWFVHAMRWVTWYNHKQVTALCSYCPASLLALSLPLPWHYHSHCIGIPKNCICFKFLVFFSADTMTHQINSLVLLVSRVLLYALTSRIFAQSKKYFIEITKNSVCLC